ncbi:MAG: hypothetical protein H7096_11720, partial [Flavobacterium sp.]|nr:hypothetical protein [Pedobacter sp.]
MKLILTILCFVFSYQLSAQKIQFIRGCNGGPDNNIYWRIYPDSCKLISTVKLFGTESQFVYPFSIIDSSLTASNKQYKHAGANIPSNKPWLYYLEYRVICGIDTMIRYTDTLSIDTVKPEATYLDSVSVDPTTNWVYLGWTSNKSIDFNTYYIYNFDRVNPILTQTHRDTFYVDNGVDPKNKSLTYQITSSDSCDNAKPYDPTPHKTIYLTSIIDTCTNIVNLNWSKYIGWPDVLKYYIFRNINQNGYALLDSTIGSINTFSDKSVSYNSSILYFVRALKGSSSRLITSTSNSIGVLSGKSINPSQTQIEYVTNNNSDQIEIQIKPNISANYSEIGLYKYVNQSPIKIYTYTGNENLYQDLAAPNTAVNRY